MEEVNKVSISHMSEAEREVLKKACCGDVNNNNNKSLSSDDILRLVSDFNEGKVNDQAVLEIMKKYDTTTVIAGTDAGDHQLSLKQHQVHKTLVALMSDEDKKVLMKAYNKEGENDGLLSGDDLMAIVTDFNNNKVTDAAVLDVLNRYDTLHHEVHLGDTGARYGAYSGAAAKIFRYLAFSSDVGEALRPVAKSIVVSGSYALSVGYCLADIGFEAYKLHERGYKSEKGVPMTMSQCVVERTVFQGVASLAVPFVVIHSAVDISRRLFSKIKRFTKWGPSVVGLSMIPLLPMYLDHPVEHAVESAFEKYGPWGGKSNSKHLDDQGRQVNDNGQQGPSQSL